MDKRLRRIDPETDRAARRDLYERLAAGKIPLSRAVVAMRRLSHLTQPEFARHRGVSLAALRQIEQGIGNPTVATLNKIASVFGLEVGFVPRQRARDEGEDA